MGDTSRSVSCLARAFQALGILILILVLIWLGLVLNQRRGLAETRRDDPPPGRLVDVGGHALHLFCVGEGTPTVVIDAGNGSLSVEWRALQESLAPSLRVCTYDRAGYGWSEAGRPPRDGGQAVAELHALLQAAQEAPPYLLVGHSLGGVHVRLFAAQYPAEVAGMVLVDTAYPLVVTPEYRQQIEASLGFYQVMEWLTASGLLRILGPLGGSSAMPETARKMRPAEQDVYLKLLLDPQQYRTAAAEMGQIPHSFTMTEEALQRTRVLENLPLIVLTAGLTVRPGSTPFRAEPMAVDRQRLAEQAELASLSTRGEQRIVALSGHAMHLDAAQEVAQAILDGAALAGDAR